MGAVSNIRGFWDKFNNRSNDYEEDYYYDDEEPVDTKSIRNYNNSDDYDEPRETRKASKVTSIARKKVSASGMEVFGIKPTSLDDEKDITNTLICNRTVVLNLEGLESELATRILDFTMGTAYALNANIQKISNGIFIIAPESVDINGSFQDYLPN